MSSPVPSSPQPDPGPGSKTRSTMLGVGIGVLAFALIAGGLFTAGALRDRLTGPDSAPDGVAPSESQERSGAPSPTASASGPMPRTDPALGRFYDQKLKWKRCGVNTCTDMSVPMDYDEPDGKKISIRVLADLAREKPLGSLVVNPGGPGGSGIDYAAAGLAAWPAALRDRYHIVGFDPRGVGKSTPLRCLRTAALDRYSQSDPDPDTEAERARFDRDVKAFGDACLARSGDLARHMSTREVVRDMDVLRHLLRQPKLDYFGASYGTTIGATYADRFPDHVGKMVLDGAVDPSMSNEKRSLVQARGFETALRAYVKDCVARRRCILGDSVDAGTSRIRSFLDQVERRPLRTEGPRRLEVGTATTGIWLPLYVKGLWPSLTSALTAAIRQRDGSALLRLSDQYTSRGRDGYTDNSLNALFAVNCLDDPTSIRTDQVPAYFDRFEEASPTFGRVFAFGLAGCHAWPVSSDGAPRALTAKGAPPIVVIGTTRDPATPLVWARALARQLDSGVLISRDGDGHTGFNQQNKCVDDAVLGYLLRDDVPRDGLRC